MLVDIFQQLRDFCHALGHRCLTRIWLQIIFVDVQARQGKR